MIRGFLVSMLKVSVSPGVGRRGEERSQVGGGLGSRGVGAPLAGQLPRRVLPVCSPTLGEPLCLADGRGPAPALWGPQSHRGGMQPTLRETQSDWEDQSLPPNFWSHGGETSPFLHYSFLQFCFFQLLLVSSSIFSLFSLSSPPSLTPPSPFSHLCLLQDDGPPSHLKPGVLVAMAPALLADHLPRNQSAKLYLASAGATAWLGQSRETVSWAFDPDPRGLPCWVKSRVSCHLVESLVPNHKQ